MSHQLRVGTSVIVGSTQLRGTVMFVGPTEFSSGDWVGIDLQEQAGKNDGCVKGVRYFQCKQMHGLFVRPSAVIIDEDVPEELPRGEGRRAETGRRDSTSSVSAATMHPSPAAAATVPSPAAAAAGPPSPNTPPKVIEQAREAPRLQAAPQPKQTQAAEASDRAPAHVPSVSSDVSEKAAARRPLSDAEAFQLARNAQQELAEAMEEHDIDGIRRALPIAADAGVAPNELDGAMRLLSFEVQRSLFREVEEMRALVTQLSDSVALAEARAQEAEQAAKAAGAFFGDDVPERPTHFADAEPSQAWIEKVGAQLEERVWSGIAARVESTVEAAVAQGTQALMTAVMEFRKASSREATGKKNVRRVRVSLTEEEAATRIQAVGRGGLARKVHQKERAKREKCFGGEDRKANAFVRLSWLTSASAIVSGQPEMVRRRRAVVEGARRGPSLISPTTEEDLMKIRGQMERNLRQGASRSTPKETPGHSQKPAAQHVEQRGKASSNRAWRLAFDAHLKDDHIELDANGFVAAMHAIHPRRLTDGQLLALWKGYSRLAGTTTMDWSGFQALSEAVATDDHCAAEFADMSVELFRTLGTPEGSAAASKIGARYRGSVVRRNSQLSSSGQQGRPPEPVEQVRVQAMPASSPNERQKHAAIVIQKNVRCLLAVKVCGKLTIEMAAYRMRLRYKPWASVFDKHSAGKTLLGEAQFEAAIQEAMPAIATPQAKALFEGFVNGMDMKGVDISGFCAMLQAGLIGDDALSEFADLCMEDFQLLAEAQGSGNEAMPEGHVDEATWRKVRPEYVRAFEEAAGGKPGLTQEAFCKAITKAQPHISEGQVHAIWKGYTNGTGRQELLLEDFCAATDAVEAGSHAAAEFADMSAEAFELLGCPKGDIAATRVQAHIRGRQSRRSLANLPEVSRFTAEREAAVIKMQTLVRIWAARRRINAIKGTSATMFFNAAMAVNSKYRAWATIFDQAQKMQIGNSHGLEEAAFANALSTVHPRFSPAQIKALWRGILEGMDVNSVDVKTFCQLCQAAFAGDDRASEFADLPEDEFAALADQPCDTVKGGA